MDLMYCDPEPDDDGEIRENLEYGGRRRIDRILYDPSLHSKPVGYRFITSFAGQTDHVPVTMSLETNLQWVSTIFSEEKKWKKNVTHENNGNCKMSFSFLHSFKNFNEKIFDLFMLEFVIQNFKI